MIEHWACSKPKCHHKTVQHSCHCHSVHERRVHLSWASVIRQPSEFASTHHHACARIAAKVQFTVDLADVISHGTYGTITGDHMAVLILQLSEERT